jgi:hypothetical protein
MKKKVLAINYDQLMASAALKKAMYKKKPRELPRLLN